VKTSETKDDEVIRNLKSILGNISNNSSILENIMQKDAVDLPEAEKDVTTENTKEDEE